MLARAQGSTPGVCVCVWAWMDPKKSDCCAGHAELNARRKRQPPAADNVDVETVEAVDGLQALLAVIDDAAEAFGAVLAADFGRDEKEVPEQLLRER